MIDLGFDLEIKLESKQQDYCWSISKDRVSGVNMYRFMMWPRNQNYNKPVISELHEYSFLACEKVLERLGDQKPWKDK